MKTSENKYIYYNPTSGHYRIIFTEQKNKKSTFHYFGSYTTVEKAREVRDTILAKTDGKSPWARFATHNMTDEQVAEHYLEKFKNGEK